MRRARGLESVLLLLAGGLVTSEGAAQPAVSEDEGWNRDRAGRPVSTYSIVARDPVSGELGVAVQSHWFSVGSVVPWAESGVGAVATQSFVEPSYGALGLELMRTGKSAAEALAGLVAADPSPAVRQVGMVDASGRAAVYTGEMAIPEACDRSEPGMTIQANLMAAPTVCDAMHRAYTESDGDLAERLMSALEAAQAEGGDIRGKQSAALLVVAAQPTGRSWKDRLYDLRIEDHPEPLVELRRVLTVARAYRHMSEADEHWAAGEMDRARQAYERASELLPGRAEPVFWHAVLLTSTGRLDAALPLFARAYRLQPAWRTLVPRLVGPGLLPDNAETIERILAAGR